MMYNPDTELVYPLRVSPVLGTMRGDDWQVLVGRISSNQADLLDQYGFVLLMVKLSGCLACNADSFRAMRGCTLCAKQTIRRYRGNDRDLIEQFNISRREVEAYVSKQALSGKVTGK
jgi:hypothetical protein